MTKQEARQIITAWLVSSKWEKGHLGYIEGWFQESDVEAFNMAIEALEQDKIIYCEDCKFLRWYEDDEYYYCALEDRPNRNWSVDETDFCSWAERRAKKNESKSIMGSNY